MIAKRRGVYPSFHLPAHFCGLEFQVKTSGYSQLVGFVVVVFGGLFFCLAMFSNFLAVSTHIWEEPQIPVWKQHWVNIKHLGRQLFFFHTVTFVKPVLKPSFEVQGRQKHDFGGLGIEGIASHLCGAAFCLPLCSSCVGGRSRNSFQVQSSLGSLQWVRYKLSSLSACCSSV